MLKAVKQTIRNSAAGPWVTSVYLRLKGQNTRGLFYDLQTVEVMKRVLKVDSLSIDVGAHEGLIFADMCRFAPAGRHYAFEPLPHLAELLRERFPSTRVIEAAAADYAGSATFNYVRNAPAYSGLKTRIYDRADPQIEQIEVEVVRIDDLVPASEKVAFLKVDVEGGEYGVIKGARETIIRSKAVVVFEAGSKSTGQYGVTAEEMYRLLDEDLGYQVSTMKAWLAGSEALSSAAFCAHWQEDTEYYFIAYPSLIFRTAT